MNSLIQFFTTKMCLINSELFKPRRRQRRNKRSRKRKKTKSKLNWKNRWQDWRSTLITSLSMDKTQHSSTRCTWSTLPSLTRTPVQTVRINNNRLILVLTPSRAAISQHMVSSLRIKNKPPTKTKTTRTMKILAKHNPLCLRTKSFCSKIKTW